MCHTRRAFFIILAGIALWQPSTFAQSFQNLIYKSTSSNLGETVDLRLDNFVSSPSNVISSDQDLIFMLHSRRNGDFGSGLYNWDLGGRYSRYERFQLWVREAYLSSGKMNILGRESRLSLGRKYFSNLKLDSVWNLGAMESQFRGDPLDPIHQGLTGLFFDMSFSPSLKFKFFASVVSFPDLGTSFDVKNGAVSSTSPWFVTAPRTVTVNGNEVPLTYDLSISNQYEKLFRFSAMTGVEWAGDTVDININAGVLPSRRWTLNVRPTAVVRNGATEVVANINPELLNRVVGSVSFDKKIGEDYVLSGEYFAESYLEDMTEGATTNDMQSNARESSFLHLGLQRQNIRLGDVEIQTGLHYLRRLKQSLLNVLQDFEYNDFNFDEAISLQVSAAYLPWNLQMQFKAFYDFTYQSVLLSPRIEYQAQKDLTLYSRFDLVGTNSTESSFLGNQKANDRFLFGITYAM